LPGSYIPIGRKPEGRPDCIKRSMRMRRQCSTTKRLKKIVFSRTARFHCRRTLARKVSSLRVFLSEQEGGRSLMYRPDRYPRNWQQLAYGCKQRAGWQCATCGVTHGTERISHRTGAVYTVFLHAAHTKLHDTCNPQPTLQALCPTCHGRHDWQLRKRDAEGTLEKHKHQLLLASQT
jgi:hypothetical protein